MTLPGTLAMKSSISKVLDRRQVGGRVDILDSEGEFAFVGVVGAALFGAAIDENTRYGAVLHVEGQGPGRFEDRPPP
jgi:hypothetical protein